VFQIDGNTVITKGFATYSPFASIPESITLNLALGGDKGGDIENAAFPDRMSMTVDYVRVYSL